MAIACGVYVLPGEYRFWLLQPDLSNQADLIPFFFNSGYLYRGDQYAAVETWPALNTREWAACFREKINKKDIDGLLMETSPQDFFSNTDQIADTSSFMRALLKPHNKALYRYLRLSKQVEQIAADPDPWDEKEFPVSQVLSIIDSAKTLYRSSGSAFVKLRTAYQLIRLYAFNGQVKEMDSVYQAAFTKPGPQTWIRSAALYQIAFRSSGYKRSYLYSKVFDRGDYNRTACLVHFNSPDLDSILPFAKNLHERNVLLAMKTFNYPGRSLHYLKKIYQSEPAYKDLSFLLLREINKTEDWLATPKLTEFKAPAVYTPEDGDNENYLTNARINYRNDRLYARQLYGFIDQMIKDKKQKNTALLNLYAAHLCLLLNETGSSAQYLNAAARGKNLSQKEKTQISISQFLLQLEKGFDENTERTFMKIIQAPNKQMGLYDPDIMKNQLILYTGRKLISQGQRAKGLMLLSRTNRALGESFRGYKKLFEIIADIACPEDYDQILRILDKKNKKPFEQFVSQKYFVMPSNSYYEPDTTNPEEAYNLYWNRSLLLDNKASWYIRNYQLPEALAVLKQIPDSYWNEWPQNPYVGGNPFYLNIHHPHKWGKEDSARSLNKKQVIAGMIQLRELARKKPSQAALCYYQLGNAWYNMTWHGKNWLMVKQSWSDDNYYKEQNNSGKYAFYKDYYGCEQAKRQYQQAIRLTRDKKLAALCFFMTEECRNNMKEYQFYRKQRHGSWDSYERKNILNKNLAKQQGINQDYYSSLIEECELYQSFVKQYSVSLIE